MKRYLVIVQHEVTVYGNSKKEAEQNVRNSEFLRNRVNLVCTYISEMALPDKEEREAIIETWEQPHKRLKA
jgi:hypothetical protein